MKTLIFVEGAITRNLTCTFCNTPFAYLFRIPQYSCAKKIFDSKAEEQIWRQEKYLQWCDLLEGKTSAVRCPHCSRYQPEMLTVLRKKVRIQGLRCTLSMFLLFAGLTCGIKYWNAFSWQAMASEILISVLVYFGLSLATVLFFSSRFGLHYITEEPIAVIPTQCSPEEQFEHYFFCVCEVLHFMLRDKKENLPKLEQVTQQIFQRAWKLPQNRVLWCEDLFWKIAILEEKNTAPENRRIAQLFQAVYLLNTLDPRAYPALPKRIVEFFNLDILTIHRWTQELGDDIHRPLFQF